MAVTTTDLPPNAAHPETVHMTVAQAIVTFLSQQFIEIDGREERVCAGGFGIFGHANAPSLGEALYAARNELPLYRGQNAQSMGLAVAAYAKAQLRRRFMFCTAFAGPGTANLLTAAALAHANRLPDPVLQQLEHFGNSALGVTDAFRAISHYWDRITHPAQILNSLPAALNTMLDPADCGPAFLALPQHLQGWAYDYPVDFFARRVHRIRRTAPDAAEVRDAATIAAPFAVDFATHARAMGALAEDVGTLDAFGAAFERARAADRTCVIVVRVDPHDGWTEQGHAWWEVGLPETSTRPGIDAARATLAVGRAKQWAGI